MTADQVVEKLYTASEVLAVTGISYRRLDFYCRSGYLADNASGSGSRRLFTSGEVDIVHAVSGLVAAGIAVPAAFAIARRLVTDGRYSVRVADIYEIDIHVITPTTEETQ